MPSSADCTLNCLTSWTTPPFPVARAFSGFFAGGFGVALRAAAAFGALRALAGAFGPDFKGPALPPGFLPLFGPGPRGTLMPLPSLSRGRAPACQIGRAHV